MTAGVEQLSFACCVVSFLCWDLSTFVVLETGKVGVMVVVL